MKIKSKTVGSGYYHHATTFNWKRKEMLTGSFVKVLVVDDDALAQVGESQVVPEAVEGGLGVHVHVAAGRGQRQPRPEGAQTTSRVISETENDDEGWTQSKEVGRTEQMPIAGQL